MMMSTTIVNHGGLFGEQDNQIPTEMGFLPLLPTNMMIFPSSLGGCHNQPFSSISTPNSLASDQADSTSNLTAETLLVAATTTTTTTTTATKSRLDLASTFGGAQFLSLNRSTINPWALGEVADCFSSKRMTIGVDDDDNNNNNNNNHVVGVSAMKMKKMKARRKVREPRFCFKTMSDVDVLDDGYKWRKYGQKVVKNTHHPRSYYRCTQDNCRVKKRVERLAEDPRMVITTYEGRHAHSPSNDLEESQTPSQLTNFFW